MLAPANEKTDVTSVFGAVGVAQSGVNIWSMYVSKFLGPATSWANSAPKQMGYAFDQCGGYAYSSREAAYGYHVAPSCLLAQLNMNAGSHSPQVGWAADGFPIYGPLGPNGTVMRRCSYSGLVEGVDVCLDECGGYAADTGDTYLYRYYMTGLVNDGTCLLYTSPSPRDATLSRMPSSA